MRLTLRTLLAFRDGVLSPMETSDLHQRIKQNELANNLLKRIDYLVKHKQLLTPKVMGEGLGGDANSVAEYLDDTLSSEQVPEFERICIAESDLLLAELAHCHQLLAEALNSQVDVRPNLRALAIGLTAPQNQADLYQRLKIGGAKNALAARPSSNIRRVDDAPSAHPADTSEEQAKDLNASERSPVQAPMVTSGGGSIKPQGLDLERPQLAHEVPQYLVGQRSGKWQIPLAIVATVALLGVITWQALGPLQNVRDLFIAHNQNTNDSNSTGVKENAESTLGKAQVPPDTNTKANTDTKLPTNATSESSAELSNQPASETPDVLVPPDAIIEETTPPPVVTPTSQADGVEGAFRWVPTGDDGESVVIVRRSVDGKAITSRLAANDPIPTDAEIIVPPFVRPTLDLAGICSWTVCGPTLMELSKNGDVKVNSSLCRALAKAGRQTGTITIAGPTGPVKVQFEDANSMAAIEVAFRSVSPGAITDKMAFKPLMIIVAVEGQIAVTPVSEASDEKSIRLVVGEGVAFTDSQPIEFELGAIPAWYRAGNDRPLDSLAAADLHNFTIGTGDLNAQLTAMSVDSRPEAAALAIQTKMLLGDWGDFASDFLTNELMRSHWSHALLLAEQLIASKDHNPEALRTAFEAAHPSRGAELFTLLAGATDGSPQKDLIPKLVESLGSSELDERVLAAHQLRRLTGKDLGFQPSFPNRAALQQWRRALTSGSLQLVNDNPIWEAKRPATTDEP